MSVGEVTESQQWDKLFAALAKAQAKIEGASKDKRNPAFNSKYADLASVWEACRSALTEQGLCVVQQPLSDGDRVGLRTTLGHSSGQWMASVVWTTPKDKTPQALGSCLTYLRRYSLAAAVGVTPDEDDDGNAASGRGAEGKARTAGTEGAAPAPRAESDAGKALKASDIRHDGHLLSDAQLRKLHVTRREAGGQFCTDEDDPNSMWRAKVLGVFRDPDGNRITSSKQLSVAQARHLIDRMTAHIAKTKERAEQLPDLAALLGAEPNLTDLVANMQQKGVPEEELCGTFAKERVLDLSRDERIMAGRLVEAWDTDRWELARDQVYTLMQERAP